MSIPNDIPGPVRYEEPAAADGLRFVFPVEDRIAQIAGSLLGGVGMLAFGFFGLLASLSFAGVPMPTGAWTPYLPPKAVNAGPIILAGLGAAMFLVCGTIRAARLPWALFGSETVEVCGETLRVTRAMLGWASTQEYRLSEMHALRVRPKDRAKLHYYEAGEETLGPFGNEAGWRYGKQRGTGGIAFNYQGEVVRIAVGIAEEDALAIILRLTPRLLKAGAHAPALIPKG